MSLWAGTGTGEQCLDIFIGFGAKYYFPSNLYIPVLNVDKYGIGDPDLAFPSNANPDPGPE
jgi:hypothetical protein